jgi:hypothetical protein
VNEFSVCAILYILGGRGYLAAVSGVTGLSRSQGRRRRLSWAGGGSPVLGSGVNASRAPDAHLPGTGGDWYGVKSVNVRKLGRVGPVSRWTPDVG